MTILYAYLILLTFGVYLYKSLHDIHMFQQNSYRADRYLRWMTQTRQPVFKKSDLMFALSLLPTAIAMFYGQTLLAWGLTLLMTPLTALSVMMFHVKITHRPAKKKLALTPRVKRLYVSAFIVFNLLMSAVFIAKNPIFGYVGILFAIVYSWAFVLAGNLVNKPIEALINFYYYKDAQKRLARNPNLIIIGITGSYGKTSVKNVLHSLLSRKYNVLMTPESYNTLLGVIRTIREQLQPTHDVLIVEMGAKELGDIGAICKLVNPNHGIITSIGPQHLESFKTLENVIKTKGELFEGVQPGGKIYLNLNDDNICTLPTRADIDYVYFGKAKPNADPRQAGHCNRRPDYTVIDDRLDHNGTAFNVQYPEGGTTHEVAELHGAVNPQQNGGGKSHKKKKKTPQLPQIKTATAHFRTRLLGAHNIDNMLGSIAIAMELGVPESDINRALFDLAPVKHRLSLYTSSKGYTVIDDAFNSNPIGSKNALEILHKMAGGKKFVMTPGMIELGEQQFALNEKFGEYMAEACDYAILVGRKQTEPIVKGLKNKKFPSEQVFVVDTVNDGFAKVNELANPGDVLLIENDLPDAFNE